MDNDSLKYLKNATWNEVFSYWKKTEEHLEHWQKYYKSKGFKSWKDWRNATFENLNGESLDWKLYEIVNPSVILDFHGGNFHAWSKWFYCALKGTTFREIAEHPGIQNFKYILELVDNFPKETVLSAVQNAGGEVYIIEGMHRSCALALLSQRSHIIDSKIKLYLGQWPKKEAPKLGTGWEK